MRLTMKEKKKLTKIVSEGYQKASKKQKRIILDEFVAITGYDRCYGSYILRNHGRKVRVNSNTPSEQIAKTGIIERGIEKAGIR